jgi:eukaryotic-like serine/threonine-protein kinase
MNGAAGAPEPGGWKAGDTESVPPEMGDLPPEWKFLDTPGGRKIPKQLGPYRILQLLGEGGMGAVYLADQSEPIRRRVALKVIKLGMDSREIIARFEAERQALALMGHPSIARVLDAGSTPDGRPYFAMEYVPGEPITQYSDRHRLTNRERLELFTQVCDAVAHAHQKAIIHRDLKPSNVLVMVQDGKPIPKIIDFGVAKAINQRLSEKTLFTELGQLIGTPEYMSPEQAEMGSLDIDTRTDIYSLGVLLYELLIGELPFSSDELRQGGFAEIQRLIREKDPPKPSTRLSGAGERSKAAEKRRADLVKLLRELRGDLDWIAMKALEKDRTRRYGTAGELAADVGRHLNDEPVLARPPSAGYRLQKFLRKNRGPVAAVAVVLLALAAGLVATSVLYIRAETERREKEQALGQKVAALQRSEGLRLIAHANAVLSANPGLALLLAIEGARSAPGLEANNALLGAVRDIHEARTLLGHAKAVRSASFSPDGRRVVTASDDGTARIWDAGTGDALLVFRHESGIISASFSPEGRRVITGSPRPTARIWDAESGQEIRALAGHEGGVTCACFSPSGRQVVTGSMDRTARIWDAETGSELHVLQGHGFNVQSAVFSRDGRQVLTVGGDHTARIWSTETGKELSVLQGVESNGACFSPDGRRVVLGVSGSMAAIRDSMTGEDLLVLRGHEGRVIDARFSMDGRRVVTCSSDKTARLWDAANGKELLVLRGHEEEILSAGFSPDGRWVVTGCPDRTARVWDVEARSKLPVLGSVSVDTGCFSPDGRRMVTFDHRGQRAQVQDAESGAVLVVIRGHAGPINFATFDPTGRRVAIGSAGAAGIWDAEDGKMLLTLRGHQGAVRSGGFSSDGRRLVTGSADNTARVWNAETGMELLEVQQGFTVRASIFSPDGRRIATLSDEGNASLWDAGTGERRLAISSETSISTLGFSPDGRRLLTGMWDGTTGIRDAESGNVLLCLKGHESLVTSASFSSDGLRVVTSSEDQTARVWAAETGKCLIVIRGQADIVTFAGFSPDGRRVVTATLDQTVRIWPLDLLPIAESMKPRELTPEEIERFEIKPPADSPSRS